MTGNTYSSLAKTNDVLLTQIRSFYSYLDTFRNKAMEDTLESIATYESARVLYDAYQTKLKELEAYPDYYKDRITEVREQTTKYQTRYLKLKKDLKDKMDMLDTKKSCGSSLAIRFLLQES